jgi:hypothetical protein
MTDIVEFFNQPVPVEVTVVVVFLSLTISLGGYLIWDARRHR